MFDNYSFIAGALCQSGDRFLRSGYKETALSLPQVIRDMGRHGLASGVELHYRGNETQEDLAGIESSLADSGLKAAFINTWTYGERKWRYGSLSSADPALRKEAVEKCKATVDIARRFSAGGLNIWLGQDGHDYAFQVDYKSQWNNLLLSIREICDYAQAMPVAVEPKPREPRNRSLIDNVQTALLLRMESGCENLGVTIDTGHVVCGGQGIGPSVEAAIRHNCLYNIHTNDNYGSWDDDMIVGSVRLMEYLELFYLLKKYAYSGYVSIDIFPYREDAVDAVVESIRALKNYESIVERLGLETIDALIREGNIPKTLSGIRQAALRG